MWIQFNLEMHRTSFAFLSLIFIIRSCSTQHAKKQIPNFIFLMLLPLIPFNVLEDTQLTFATSVLAQYLTFISRIVVAGNPIYILSLIQIGKNCGNVVFVYAILSRIQRSWMRIPLTQTVGEQRSDSVQKLTQPVAVRGLARKPE